MTLSYALFAITARTKRIINGQFVRYVTKKWARNFCEV